MSDKIQKPSKSFSEEKKRRIARSIIEFFSLRNYFPGIKPGEGLLRYMVRMESEREGRI